MSSSTGGPAHNILHTALLFEEVSIDLKLLLQHHLPPIFDDQSVGFQVSGCTENLPVLLDPGHPPQLQLEEARLSQFSERGKGGFMVRGGGGGLTCI